ncbi:MAG: toll/interleukin-1 receptor domain-containing protein, partial [Aestuariivirga sp.]|nr:toll/interleukin-1 receptor domain-containing protein [Aestuariivirga sp.]
MVNDTPFSSISSATTAAEWLDRCDKHEEWVSGGSPMVMISYSHGDRVWVDHAQNFIGDVFRHGDLLCSETGEPYKLWDFAGKGTGTRLGQHFPTEVAQKMWECRAAIIIFSQSYVNSPFCRDIELPFLLWRRRHHGTPLFILRVSDTTRDRRAWRVPGGEPMLLEDLVDDRNPALGGAGGAAAGLTLDQLNPPQLTQRFVAVAKGIEEQVKAIEKARKDAREAAKAAEKEQQAEQERLAREAEEAAEAQRRAAERERAAREADEKERLEEEARKAKEAENGPGETGQTPEGPVPGTPVVPVDSVTTEPVGGPAGPVGPFPMVPGLVIFMVVVSVLAGIAYWNGWIGSKPANPTGSGATNQTAAAIVAPKATADGNATGVASAAAEQAAAEAAAKKAVEIAAKTAAEAAAIKAAEAAAAAAACDRAAMAPSDSRATPQTPGVELSAIPATALSDCRRAVELNPDNVTLLFQLGRALQADQQYLEAMRTYLAAAGRGDVLSKNNIGSLYSDHPDVFIAAKDSFGCSDKADCDEKAVTWYAKAVTSYAKAAKQEQAGAQNNLGWMYEKKLGVRNRTEEPELNCTDDADCNEKA